MITRLIQAIYHRNRFVQILILTVRDTLRFIRHAGEFHHTNSPHNRSCNDLLIGKEIQSSYKALCGCTIY